MIGQNYYSELEEGEKKSTLTEIETTNNNGNGVLPELNDNNNGNGFFKRSKWPLLILLLIGFYAITKK